MPNLKNENTDALFRAILSLKDVDECYNFFTDLCSIKELLDMEQRFTVARMLSAGMTYNEIAEKCGASTTTIARINKCLLYGENGYKTVIGRI